MRPKPSILPAMLLALATGCDILGIGTACTLIGCYNGIAVHLAALPSGPYKVEILVAGAAPGLYEYDCAGGEACQQDVFFPELVLDRIVVKVTTSLGSRITEIANPVYETSRPNGPDCSPLCRQASVTAQLPGL